MQLDGPDLEDLLLRAREQYGDQVRVVKADRVRTGGLGGFFARERFELTVEVDDESPARAHPPAAPLPPPPAPVVPDEEPFTLLDLADAVSERERDVPRVVVGAPRKPARSHEPQKPEERSAPRISTESESFASILARLTESAEGPEPAAHAGTVVSVPNSAAVLAERPKAAAAHLPARPKAANLTARTLADLGLPDTLLPSGGADALAALVTALRALPPAPPLPQGAGQVLAVVGDGTTAWEAGLNLGSAMNLDERHVHLLSRRAAALRVPAARRVETADDLDLRVERWRRRTAPTVVVVDASMSPSDIAWYGPMLDKLDATATWLVVPATRKTADVARWADRFGRGDALVVTDVDGSDDPASVLGLGLPVAWLDGQPATPRAWAGLLVERLVEAA